MNICGLCGCASIVDIHACTVQCEIVHTTKSSFRRRRRSTVRLFFFPFKLFSSFVVANQAILHRAGNQYKPKLCLMLFTCCAIQTKMLWQANAFMVVVVQFPRTILNHFWVLRLYLMSVKLSRLLCDENHAQCTLYSVHFTYAGNRCCAYCWVTTISHKSFLYLNKI